MKYTDEMSFDDKGILATVKLIVASYPEINDAEKLEAAIYEEIRKVKSISSNLPVSGSLPTYADCTEADKNGKMTPLHEFIFNNEPEGEIREKKFREGLQKLVSWLRQWPQ